MKADTDLCNRFSGRGSYMPLGTPWQAITSLVPKLEAQFVLDRENSDKITNMAVTGDLILIDIISPRVICDEPKSCRNTCIRVRLYKSLTSLYIRPGCRNMEFNQLNQLKIQILKYAVHEFCYIIILISY